MSDNTGEYKSCDKLADEIERLRMVTAPGSCECSPEEACRYARERDDARAEIQRLRAYITEIEKWKNEGERILGPAAQWGPNGNVLVQTSTMFKLGAWWADRPWKRKTIPFCASCGKQKERCDGC